MGGGAARTLGYYEPGDGGGAIYRIVETSSDLTVALDNGLYAELNIDNNILNGKLLGAYGDGIHDDSTIIQSGIDYCSINNIAFYLSKASYKANIIISDNNNIYDFGESTIIGKVTINDTINVRIYNLFIENTEDVCLNIKGRSYNNIFYNCRFSKSPVSLISCENETWATRYDKCNFIGDGNIFCMNFGSSTNDTLVLNNCYFYNFDSILKGSSNIHVSIIGGYQDSVSKVINLTDSTNGSISICGYDFESFDYILYNVGSSWINISIDGYIATCREALLYSSSYGATINLFVNHLDAVSNFKIKTSDTRGYVYSSIHGYKDTSFPFLTVAQNYEMSILVFPKTTMQVLPWCYINSVTYTYDSNIIVRARTGTISSGAAINDVSPLYLTNNSDTAKTVTLTVSSLSKLVY